MSIKHVEYLDMDKTPAAETYGYRGPGWYFWDETGACCHGPYVGEIVASKALEKYAQLLESDAAKSIEAVSFLPFVRSTSP